MINEDKKEKMDCHVACNDAFSHPACRIDLRIAGSHKEVDSQHKEEILERVRNDIKGKFLVPLKKAAFTLAEVLITLGIIGVVAAMTLPALIQKQQEKQLVSGVLKFYSTLSQAVDLLIAKNDGVEIFTILSDCKDNDVTAFDNIEKEMKILDKCTRPNCRTAQWLPDYALTYSGENKSGLQFGIAKNAYGDVCYLLADGTTFCLDINQGFYCVTVDVNGKKKPNRVGRDIFSFKIGGRGQKVTPDEAHINASNVLTSYDTSYNCPNPLNLDPQKGGVCPTSYVLLTKKLPPEYNKKAN